MLTPEMVDLIDGFSAAVVATVTADGRAAASVKGTFVVEDDCHVAFGDIRSPGTRTNLEANSSVEAVFTDVLSRQAVRVAGTAEILEEPGALGEVFDASWAPFRHLMGRFVRITVERAEIITSPSYDIDLRRGELIDTSLQRLDAIAHRGRSAATTSVNDHGQAVGASLDGFAAPDAPSTASMTGEHCTLVSLDVAAHGYQLFEAFVEASDDSDWTYLPYGPFANMDSFVAWVGSVEGLSDPVFFAILDNATGAAVGVASYLRVAPAVASIEVGNIHLSRRLQRTAAATEAMFLMMKRAFDAGYRRYEWKCDDLNGPSRAAANRLGFRYEGTFRQAVHYKGRNRDTAWHSILDSEWPRIEAEFTRWLDPFNFDAGGRQLSRLRMAD